MTPRSLADWLSWQEGLNPRQIELGLDRISAVWQRLGAPRPARVVITVGGTNGKGSSCAMLESTCLAAGYRTGLYTSPHLARYNERIRLDGAEAADEAICQAFERIEQARGETPLTYFEFGTLAALLIFADAGLDVAILEVGLGGRLDAVNMIDADAALVTGVDLDHQDWLGDSIEAIGFEKAGIYRGGRPAVFAGDQPPDSLCRYAAAIGADLLLAGRDFRAVPQDGQWEWQGRDSRRSGLPLPGLRGRHQLANAAGVLAVLAALSDVLPVDQNAVRTGLLGARQAGRFEMHPGRVSWVLDVAHNPQAARALADTLFTVPRQGRLYAVLGMLADKDVTGVFSALEGQVDTWLAAGLAVPRGLSAQELVKRLPEGATIAGVSRTVAQAMQSAAELASDGDLVLVFGSFHTVAEAGDWLSAHGL